MVGGKIGGGKEIKERKWVSTEGRVWAHGNIKSQSVTHNIREASGKGKKRVTKRKQPLKGTTNVFSATPGGDRVGPGKKILEK